MRQRRRKPACAIESIEGRVLFATIYVDVNTSGATHDGTSWGNAFTDLQQALTIATVGDEIRVADGTYKPTATLDRSITFQMKSGVSIYGGYAGDGAANPNLRDVDALATILSGDIGASGYSYTVVTGSGTDATALLDGFTVVKGSGGISLETSGAGLNVNGGSPRIANCTFTEHARRAVNMYGGSATLMHCIFTGNTDENEGAAMYLSAAAAPVVTDCTFGGAGSTSLIYSRGSAGIFTNCDFRDYKYYAFLAQYGGNTAFSGCTFTPEWQFADGVICQQSSSSFTNCDFSGYRSSAIINSNSSLQISGCVFTDNRDANGGAIYNADGSTTSLTNCTFINNVATGHDGGAIYNKTSTISLTNCTFSGNSANDRGGAIYNSPTSSMTATGCVMKENIARNGGAIYSEQASTSYLGCTFEANLATGLGNIRIGGAVFNDTSTASYSNCQFLNNASLASSSLSDGSTIYNIATSSTISGCTFIGNYVAVDRAQNASASAIHSGAGCNVVISDSLFGSNFVTNGGSLIYNLSSTQTISNCVFESNRSTNIVYRTGGGSPCSYVDCTFTRNNGRALAGAGLIRNCGFFGNTGGGITLGSGSTVVNCIFVGNSATTGAAISAPGTGSSVINSTFLNNSATNGGGISITGPATIANCIIRANTATNGAQIRVVSGSVDVSYSNVQGGFAGTGNIDADPQFVRNPSAGFDGVWRTGDDDYGDLKLRITSSSIDAGSNAAVPAGVTTDAAGNARILDVPGKNDPGAIVDMGAYERIAPHADADFLHNAARPSIKITFNDDVLLGTLSSSDLVLMNLTTGLPVDCGADSTVTYDAGTRTATWAFSILLADGNYRATLAPGNVHDLADSPILSTELTYDFFALAGDANRDRKVDLADLNALAMNWNGSGKTFSQGDFNYDGTVDAYDLAILSTHWQQNLATHVEAVPVSIKRTASRAPVRVASMVL